MPVSTSAVAAAIAVEGVVLQVGAGSPVVFTSICNVQDWAEPNKADTVDVTNVGDQFKRRISTLLDIGVCKAKIFWVMTEPTHADLITGAVDGIRYLMLNRILAPWQIVYPMPTQPVDRFQAYVTGFDAMGKVGGVFEATIELSPNDGAPLLC